MFYRKSKTVKKLNIQVGSTNPVKVNASKAAFKAYFPDHDVNVIAVSAPSNVADQPMTECETLLGARNRVSFCQNEQANSDFYIAIEGGVEAHEYGPAAFAYVVINNGHKEAVGKSAELPLPISVYQALSQGQELGDVIDSLFNTENAKQKTGAMGLFTNDLVTRQSTYEQALILALAKLVNANLYSD